MSWFWTFDWIVQYMLHPCIPDDTYVERRTILRRGSFQNGRDLLPNISAHINRFCGFSSWSRKFPTRCNYSLEGYSITSQHVPGLQHKHASQQELQKPSKSEKYPRKLNSKPPALWILFCCLIVFQTLSGAESKPLLAKREPERPNQDPRYVGSAYPPRVLMPPLDLGFRGQISSSEEERQARQNNLAANYQSDESAGNRWNQEPYAELQEQTQQQRRFPAERTRLELTRRQSGQVPQYPYANGYAQNQWTPNIGYDPSQYQVQYLQSREPTSLSNPVAQSMNTYVGGTPQGYSPMQQPGLQQRMLYQPRYPMYEDNRELMNGPAPFASVTSNRNPYSTYGQPMGNPNPQTWYGAYGQQRLMSPYYPYDNRPVYQPRVDTPNVQSEFSLQRPTAVLGPAANYDVITEEEVERRLKEYNDYLASRKENNQKKPNSKGGLPHTVHPDNGLQLKGSQAHEKVLRDFSRIASHLSLQGVDTLFDEIDLNKDGVIKLEEFRTFLWFHEIGVQD